jgi:endoglucanase
MSHRWKPILLGGLSVAAALVAAGNVLAGAALAPQTQLYVPKPLHGALAQIADLTAQGQKADAELVRTIVDTPQAVWFTGGTPKDVQQDVKNTVQLAHAKQALPVLVAYDVPGRDCAQYSAGGAATGADYLAWIGGFAAGLGDTQTLVVLEPDGLALLPTDCGQPDTYDRVALIRSAAQAIEQADPNARVYLDAGHSAWHAVGDMAQRLVAAGVQDDAGFFLNVSNYRATPNETKFGTWISSCIAFANDAEEGGWRLGHYDWCASQYYPADPNDFSTWHLTDEWYAANLGHAVPSTHFVIDTSRNGQGPWMPGTHPAGDPQDWCNPPGRGLGIRPTTDTGAALLDAYLWMKIPGASDGGCYRWTSGPADPVRDMVDPAAGEWFPQMALELAHNASPPLP